MQNAFHAILGIGPNAWLKRIRLNAVRRELISPLVRAQDGQGRRPCSGDSGIWGQFATDYQQLFAEKPSMTLHHRLRQWV
ncbi:AraC family transcriptional regulator [Klebsiella pneumoniae]|nr:AraC family transcriptional regulator [Klebsiella pneumoniae]